MSQAHIVCFFSCSSLSNVVFPEGDFIGEKLSNASYMFYGCSALTSLDLSGFYLKKITNLENMFNNATSLKSINFGDNFNTSTAIQMNGMFHTCSSLTSLDLSKFETENVNNMQ